MFSMQGEGHEWFGTSTAILSRDFIHDGSHRIVAIYTKNTVSFNVFFCFDLFVSIYFD